MERKLNKYQIHIHNKNMEEWYKHFKLYEDLKDIFERLERDGILSELSGDEKIAINKFLRDNPSYMYTVENVPRKWLMIKLYKNIIHKEENKALKKEVNEWITKYKLKLKLRD